MAEAADQVRTAGIGDYLLERLRAHGVEHVFGVPGDFALALCKKIEQSPLAFVNTCDEQGAGFAADAYARVRGLGAACVTYSVGGFKLANSTGQAYAEESPVVVISGAPGLAERERHSLLHHKVRDFDDQLKVFQELTEFAAVLDDPEIAAREIDRAIATARRESRPVYLELPRDMVDAEIEIQPRPAKPEKPSHAPTLAAAVAEARERIAAAERPVVVIGVEIQRFKLEEPLLRLVEGAGLPVAETLLGKSAIDEDHPCFIGVYAGRMGSDSARAYVEASDCVVLLGTQLTDLNLGGFTANLDQAKSIHATRRRVTIGYRLYEEVRLADFIDGLAAADLPVVDTIAAPYTPEATALPAVDPATPITVDRLFARLAGVLTPDTVVIADPGDALFAAAMLPIRRGTGFISPAYYASLGFAVPASLGVGLAEPACRPLVLVGDGAFQMTGQELSTAVRYGLSPIVVVLNNDGYATERFLLDGRFNDLLRWHYHRLPELLGAGRGFLVETDGDLERALAAALAETGTFSLLDVRLGRFDVSAPLRALAERLGTAAAATRIVPEGVA